MEMNPVARDWSAVAEAWDAYADKVDVTAEATATLFERVAIQPGDRVLELAAGPGMFGPTLSRLAGSGGTVVLSDIAPGMVEVAARRNAGLGNVSARLLDASAIDLPDASFDVVVCRMGLQFAPDPEVVLRGIHRVLAPGGRLGVMTWAGLAHNPWMVCIGMAAMMNGVITGGIPDGPGGPFSLGDSVQLAALAKEAGFVDVAVDEAPARFVAADIQSHIAQITSLAAPLTGAFKAATPEQVAAVNKTAGELAAPYTSEAGVDLPGRTLLLVGRR